MEWVAIAGARWEAGGIVADVVATVVALGAGAGVDVAVVDKTAGAAATEAVPSGIAKPFFVNLFGQ